MSETILKQISKDLEFVKERVIDIEGELADLSSNFYDIKPEYLKKLKSIEKEKSIPFKNMAELRKIIEG